MTATLTTPEVLSMADDDSIAAQSFFAIGTTHEILATRPDVLASAVAVAKDHLAALDAACSRFRDDSELSRLAAIAVESDAVAYVSPLCVDYLRAAQHAASITDGLVDFTVGSALIGAGYDQDIDAVRTRESFAPSAAEVPGWQRVSIGDLGRVSVPHGTVIDLGASAKAHAADMIARLLAARFPGGFLVNLGGDIATAGPAPADGWAVGVEGPDGSQRQAVAITDQAITTSSTQLRQWRTEDGLTHHIIDPRTGVPALAVWAQVTCVSVTALEANAASTAALVLGAQAPAWLEEQGIPARLERLDGSAVYTGGWPIPEPNEGEI